MDLSGKIKTMSNILDYTCFLLLRMAILDQKYKKYIKFNAFSHFVSYITYTFDVFIHSFDALNDNLQRK